VLVGWRRGSTRAGASKWMTRLSIPPFLEGAEGRCLVGFSHYADVEDCPVYGYDEVGLSDLTAEEGDIAIWIGREGETHVLMGLCLLQTAC
jgi:hypothetical protein